MNAASYAWLLISLLLNGAAVALLLRARHRARAARGHAQREARLHSWSDTLRDVSDPAACAQALHDALAAAGGVPVAVLVSTAMPAAREPREPRERRERREPREPREHGPAVFQVGGASDAQQTGLTPCVRLGEALGPGSRRDMAQPAVYLPLRGRDTTLGAAVLCGLGAPGVWRCGATGNRPRRSSGATAGQAGTQARRAAPAAR